MPSRIMPLAPAEISSLGANLREPVGYRKSGLSLNHIVGCPLDCAYCVRHRDGNYEMKAPHMLMTDEDAVGHLQKHKYFQRDITPLQILNKATDGFLPAVEPHLLKTLELLDAAGLRNHTLIITRYRVSEDACRRLNALKHLRVTLLVTYSGITDHRIEPIANHIPIASLKLAYAAARQYRVVLYWRPIIHGLNDSSEDIATACSLGEHAHAVVFTGLFYNREIKQYFEDCGLPQLYNESARRKILPQSLEARILAATVGTPAYGKMFRKTSCGVAFAHAVPDYNGHYGIREICDICPESQVEICAGALVRPTEDQVRQAGRLIGLTDMRFRITDRAVETQGLDEEPRYFLQHSLGFQVHDARYPHHLGRHGRADLGWS